jgi:AcrR family transcriptional regulator
VLPNVPRETAQPRLGRPPSVSTRAIVNAALEIGLDKVSFRQIAERLGVNVATVYRYVHDRNELLRLAAFELALSRRLPELEYPHWSQLATRYAEEMFESLLAEPELVSGLLKGSIGAHLEMDVLEQFLAAMTRYGFSPEDALELHRAVGTLVMGAATGAIAIRAREAAGIPWQVEIRRTLIERAESDLPHLRQAMASYLKVDEWHWRAPLRRLLAGIAAARGEQLPMSEGHTARPTKRPARKPSGGSAGVARAASTKQ